MEWHKYTQDQKKRQNHSLKLTVFAAWKYHAKQSSLVKRYLKECDYKSKSDESSDIKTPRSHKPSHYNAYNQDLNYIESKENISNLNTIDPNVNTNALHGFSVNSKYY